MHIRSAPLIAPLRNVRPWRRLLALTPVVVGLHVAMWQGVVGASPMDAPPVASPKAMQVRTVVIEPPPVVAVAAIAPASMTPKRVFAPRATPTASPVVPRAEAVAVRMQDAEAGADGWQIAAAPTVAPAASSPDADNETPDVPTYRTRLPATVSLIYELRRGFLSGTGQLEWRLANGRYFMQLDGRVAGLSVITQVSEGGIDRAGVAPDRFTDRRRKGEQAANFRRDTNRITFSGPSTEYPLLPGTQDRLSWMVQLPAIVAAAPERFAAGKRVTLYVAGARGDADVWHFQVIGTETMAPGEGSAASALKLVREPRKPNDTHVEVWLDPKRQYLPVRARLTSNGDTLELLLQRTATPS
jgi:hypothetical protein